MKDKEQAPLAMLWSILGIHELCFTSGCLRSPSGASPPQSIPFPAPGPQDSSSLPVSRATDQQTDLLFPITMWLFKNNFQPYLCIKQAQESCSIIIITTVMNNLFLCAQNISQSFCFSAILLENISKTLFHL